MMNKKICFLIATLCCLFSAATDCCLKVLKKQQPVFKSLYFENLELKREIVEMELELRHRSHIIVGVSPAAAAFFNSIYSAKESSDVDKALMERGEFYIKHYRAEEIKKCSALGIITMAESMPFPEKKICIQKLSSYEFKPTPRDKELALLEKCKRCSNKICETMILLGYVLEKHRKDFFKSSRKKFKSSRKSRQRITLFLFDLEELLF